MLGRTWLSHRKPAREQGLTKLRSRSKDRSRDDKSRDAKTTLPRTAAARLRVLIPCYRSVAQGNSTRGKTAWVKCGIGYLRSRFKVQEAASMRRSTPASKPPMSGAITGIGA